MIKKIICLILVISIGSGNGPVVVWAVGEATNSGLTTSSPPATASAEISDPGLIEEVVTPSTSPILSVEPKTPESGVIRIPAKLQEMGKTDFKSTEAVAATIYNPQDEEVTVNILDSNGNKVDIEIEQFDRENQTVLTISQNPRDFRPGKFELQVTTSQGTSSQNFSWGILAINPNKTIYQPAEKADFSIAVLDDNGMMVCDAKVELEILDPNGHTVKFDSQGNGVGVNPECSRHDFTTKPDYEAHYIVESEGIYTLTLTAITANGSHSISDSFKVLNKVDFEVERVGATRIFPPKSYPMSLKITANRDFNGVVTETVPLDFQIQKSPENQAFDSVKQVDVDSFLEPQGKTGDIPNLGLPFAGDYNVTARFGDQLRDPTQVGIYQEFGLAGHDGMDFDLPKGIEVLAVDQGEVVKAQSEDVYGTTVVIEHSWGRSYYGHLSQIEVGIGQKLAKGQKLGLSGDTGLSTGPHLHFGIKPKDPDLENGYYGKIDPATYLGLFSDAFELTPETQNAPVKVISWYLDIKKGDSATLSYSFLAPNNSPQFYGLGPLRFLEGGANLIYQESRLWQLAIDAPTNKASVFYLRSTTSASAFSTTGPTAEQSTATDLASGSPASKTTALAMTTDPGTTQTSVAGTETSTSAGSIWYRSFLSPRLAAQTLYSGTRFRFEGALQENNAGANVGFTLHIYQWREGTGFVASVIDNVGAPTLCGGEPGAINSERNEICITAATASNISFLDGDQLTLELWVNFNNTVATSFTGTVYFEGNDFIGQAAANNGTVIADAMSNLSSSQTLALQSDSSNKTVWYPRPITASTAFGTTGPTAEQSGASDLNSASPTLKTTALAMTSDIGDVQTSVAGTETSTSAGSSWFRTFLSPRLAAQTLSTGAIFRFEGALTESNLGANAGYTLHIYQYREGTGFVASIIDAATTPTLCGGEPGAVNSERIEVCLTATTGSDITFTAGDQIALEVWVNFNNTAATSWDSTIYFGGNNFLEQAVTNNGTVANNAMMALSVTQNLTLVAPTYTQNQFRFYQNIDSVQPTTAITGENATSYINSVGNPVQLRMNLTVATANLTASTEQFKLQYSTSTSGPWTDVGNSGDKWCSTGAGNGATACNSSGWLSRKKITFNHEAFAEDKTNFPVLVNLSSANIDYADTMSEGEDVRFVDPADNTTLLDHDIEDWNEAGTSYVWVEVPTITAYSTTDYIWLYYNNASATNGEDQANTWNSNFAAVYHMDDDPSISTDGDCGGGTAEACDSTSNNNDLDSNGAMTTSDQVAGQVDGSFDLDGTNDFLSVADNASLSPTTALTVSTWVNQNTLAVNRAIAAKWNHGVAGSTETWAFQTDGTTNTALSVFIASDANDLGANFGTTAAGSFSTGWHQVSFVYDGAGVNDTDELKIFVDGIPRAVTITGAIPDTLQDSNAALRIGDFQVLNRFWNGKTDEFQISNTALSAEWLRLSYVNQSNQSQFLTIGSEESAESSWMFYNNPTPSDGDAISSTLLSASDVTESYEENNPTIANLNAISTGQDGEWGFALDPANATTETPYFFRMIRVSGTVLDTYTNYPKIVIVSLSRLMRHGNWFNSSGVEQTFTF